MGVTMNKSKQTIRRVCAVCGCEIKGLPYQAAGIIKEGDSYLSIVACSREHQHAYAERNKTMHCLEEEQHATFN